MTIVKFLESFKKSESIQSPVVCLTSSHYSLLFCSTIVHYINSCYPVKWLSLDELEESVWKSQLSTSFLGQSFIYWCGSLHDSKPDTKKNFLSFAEHYSGPHSLWFFADTVEHQSKQWRIITIEPEITIQNLDDLSSILYAQSQRKKSITLQRLFGTKHTFSLDESSILLRYGFLLSKKNSEIFGEQWLPLLLDPEKSLFKLSGSLFSKKPDLFFDAWREISPEYSPQFWTVYWADQLFRAAWYCYYMRNELHDQAKKIAYKLPFSFIKKDWKLYRFESLITIHDIIYTLDNRMKQGGSEHLLEYIFFTMFQK